MTTSSTNPLLQKTELPLFDQIKPEHVSAAMDELLARAEAALSEVTQAGFPASWTGISRVLDVATENLSRAWGAVSHLNSVADTAELRAAYNAALPRVTEFWTRLGADERLYAKYKAIDISSLNAEQRQAHKNAVRNFVLSGAELSGEPKTRFATIQERQAELSQKFSENVLDATDQWTLLVSPAEMAGVPEDVCKSTQAAAQALGQEGHLLNLKMPCYLPIMQYAKSSGLREKLYRAYATRASDQADKPEQDNTALIQEILALRQEEAHLLGYANFAEVSLANKMATSPEHVVAFLRDLAQRARPSAERDVAEMRSFAAEHLGLKDPQPWDWTYIGEKLKEARYAFSDQDVKPYFTAPKVLAGLFKIVETLFEVNIRADSAPTWHPGVGFYRIERAGQLIGQFYLDPSARSGKRGGAWMDECLVRSRRPDGTAVLPVAYLICNQSPPVGDTPSLMTFEEVETLFHEFGHGLQHMLTTVERPQAAGINNVEWDAVELPSQFMENWCYDRATLMGMARHWQSGEPLPEGEYQKLLVARTFMGGSATLRQVHFALTDLRLHSAWSPACGQSPEELRREIARNTTVLEPIAEDAFLCAFSHIFAGGYSAGYYSYKWAEVLSADAFSAFEEVGLEQEEEIVATGRRFRDTVLSLGGSRSPAEVFEAFRGRQPSSEALIRHSGLVAA